MSEEKIIKIEEFGFYDTYDLEVNHFSHSFYANNVSVSNSHSISYSILSYQCAQLFNYYPAEWVAAFLDKEPETRKESAIMLAKQMGFRIQSLDINKSGITWEISDDGKTLIQPLTSIKGLGEAAIQQILTNRPYNKVEDLILNDNIIYAKLNKKMFDVLAKSGALNCLMDERFKGLKHFWWCVCGDRAKTHKSFEEKIFKYSFEEEFTLEERIEHLTAITGIFPIHLILDEIVRMKLESLQIPSLGRFDKELGVAWCIPREMEVKKTKKGKDYYVVNCIDDAFTMIPVRCWRVDASKDKIYFNRPYLIKLNYDEKWGFSTDGTIKKSWKLLG